MQIGFKWKADFPRDQEEQAERNWKVEKSWEINRLSAIRAAMPDQIFENSRLVAIYDDLDRPRRDLEHYLAIAYELKVRSVLDVGSGTGCLAILLSSRGFDVTGLEPPIASLVLARQKPNAEKVRWIVGHAEKLPPMAVDLAVMTGNVAQVFLSDQTWESTMVAIRKALAPRGHLVFEVRDPSQKAWLDWTKEKLINVNALRAWGA